MRAATVSVSHPNPCHSPAPQRILGRMSRPRPDQPLLLPDAGPAAPRPTSRSSRPAAPASSAAGQRFDTVADVAVAQFGDALSYGVPAALQAALVAGVRVAVPLRGKLQVGVVLRVRPASEVAQLADKLRPVAALADDAPPLPQELLATLGFVARYYQASVGQAVRLALPAVLRHTGVGDDTAPVKEEAWIGATFVRPWPHDLSKPAIRTLQRIETEGALPVATLRKKAPAERPDPAQPSDDASSAAQRRQSVPQTLLDDLQARGLVRQWTERVLRDPLGLRQPVPRDRPPTLRAGQQAAADQLLAAAREQRFAGVLLHGVTGSGKTEVYLALVEAVLATGRGAIVLVPEIALTPQLVTRFRARLGDQVAALHSAMSEGERLDQFSQIASGQRRVVVGPRSALFAPVPALGAIVVDECHDSSFKQGSGIRYHARDVALYRAQQAGAVCVLGSATPGCEELLLAQSGKLLRLDLHERASGGQLPAVRLIDLKTAERLREPDDDRPSLLSRELAEAVAATVARGEQVMLLHNRRGFATSLVCQGCGAALECPDCAISLTYHKAQGRMRCHACDYSLPLSASCAVCGSHNHLPVGAGTERIEQTLAALYPHLRIARFDRDTASGQNLLSILERFGRRELDVLVGTQMLAKGHDFPAVTLVGVLLAESGLLIPDFRASERTFQLLTQVAGRAGRADLPGQVLVQSFQPEHPAISTALRHDFDAFAAAEQAERRLQRQPPYVHMALLETRHEDAELARSALADACALLRDGPEADALEIRGPILAGLARVRGLWRIHALVQATERPPLHQALARLRRSWRPPSAVEWSLDVDPQAFM